MVVELKTEQKTEYLGISNTFRKTINKLYDKATVEINTTVTFNDITIPNLSYEYITSEKAPQKLKDYYTFVVAPLLQERYLHDGEQNEIDLFKRVAETIGNNDIEKELFYKLMRLRLFLPATPTLMNSGRKTQTLSSCFTLVPEDNMDSITTYWKEMALIQKSGGGVGTDWSAIRPEGEAVAGTGGIASGFKPFFVVANSINEAIKQGSARSGANSATMRYNHPDIMAFIDLKRNNPSQYAFFNLSVTFDDEGFIKCWNNEEIELVHNNKVYSTIRGRVILERMAENAWKTGDPSIYFLDRVNETWKFFKLDEAIDPFGKTYGIKITHNPCGEQSLPNNGVCNLASVNLFAMTNPISNIFSFTLLTQVARTASLFLDNVIDKNWFPSDKIYKQSLHLRNVGLGFMGLADVLYLKELSYGSAKSIDLINDITKTLTNQASRESAIIAEEKGVAPVFEGTDFNYRNTDFTCIAPTGSISLLSLCNTGVEPFFSLHYKKLVYPKGTRQIEKYIDIEPPSFMLFGSRQIPKTAKDITPDAHLKVLTTVSQQVTNAVSKTVNLSNDTTKEEILNLYKKAFDQKAKSITVFRDGCRNDLALIDMSNEINESKEINVSSVSNVSNVNGLVCPVCGSSNLKNENRCWSCMSCNWSACPT